MAPKVSEALLAQLVTIESDVDRRIAQLVTEGRLSARQLWQLVRACSRRRRRHERATRAAHLIHRAAHRPR